MLRLPRLAPHPHNHGAAASWACLAFVLLLSLVLWAAALWIGRAMVAIVAAG